MCIRDRFNTLKQSDEALDAFNKAVYGSNKESYQDVIDYATSEEMTRHYANEKKKFDNASFISQEDSKPNKIAFTSVATRRNRSGENKLMRYPFDIDVNQDHFKITRYNYVRPNLNMSKSAGRTNIYSATSSESTVAGDSVVGSDIRGTVILPMPKVTDVNGVEWGKSELNLSLIHI